MSNRRNLIAVLTILLVILIGVVTVCGVALITSGDNSKKYNEILASAEKYLESKDYDNAIIEFKKAIESDDTNEEAYLQLAYVYYIISDLQNSYNTLKSCLLKIDSYRAQAFIDAYLKELAATEENAEKTLFAKEKTQDGISMNRTFISQMAEYTAEEYELKYGSPAMFLDNDIYTYTYGNIDAEFKYYNTASEKNIINEDLNKPNSEAKPMEIIVDDLSLIFSGMGETLTYEEMKSENLSDLKIKENAEWNYCVIFKYSGCKFTIESSKEGEIKRDSKNKIEPITRTPIANKFVLKGYVKDATTNQGIDEAKISIREGLSETGEVIEVTYSDSIGYYSIELPDGDYNVYIEKEGWTEETFKVHVNDYEEETEADFIINPIVKEGEIRIVLTWGSSPKDLDSYLFGELDDGTDAFVSFYNRQTFDADNNLVAELDVDVTNGYGPETITIYNTKGNFKYDVHDFCHESNMNHSEAIVKIYMPDQSAPVEYTVIPDACNHWTVFEINNGEITTINSSEPHSTVGYRNK